MKTIIMTLVALPMMAGAVTIVDPAQFGFDPSAEPATNSVALQKALDGGNRLVKVTKPGVYGMDRTVFIDSHTELEFAPGVVLQKRAKFANVLVNRGAYENYANEDITVRNLEISVNDFQAVPAANSPAKNLRGQLAFYRVHDIKVYGFKCVDLGNYQYCVQFVDFDGILLDGFEIRGHKDGVHFNCGRNFTVRNGVMAVEDDGIAINAGDWPDCAPKMGSLENGLIEKIVFKQTEGEGLKQRGEIARVIAGSWPDWHQGIKLQRNDIIRAGKNVYGVFPMEFSTNEYASVTMPTHTHGIWKSPEGIKFCFLQSNAVTRAEVRNVVFRDVVNEHPRGFLVQWETGSAWARLVHTEVTPDKYPVIDVTFERVRSLYPDQPLVRGSAPCDLKFKDVSSAGTIVQMGAPSNSAGRKYKGIRRRITCTDSTFAGKKRLDFWFWGDAENTLILSNNHEEARPVGIEARLGTKLYLVPEKMNGRKVEFSRVTWGAESGYAKPFESDEILEHPVAEKDKVGCPLYVVLHSSGHNGIKAFCCTRQPGNHDIYTSPDDCYALYLDCTMNDARDWWWGYNTAHGFALSPCERRVMAAIERTVVKYGIDRNRIYLSGNSMGGSGTLGIGMRHGDVFAAIKGNTPALVEHVCDRMGWGNVAIPEGVKLPDPPILIDYSSTVDKWSRGHERLVQMMHDRKYAFYFYWGAYGHANADPKILPMNDLVHSFDWLSIRKNEIYPVFTDATSDTAAPNPFFDEAVKTPGQFNAFFRWRDAQDDAKGAQITLFLQDLKSKHFATPTQASATVTLRRLQNLKVHPGDVFSWLYGDKRGELKVGADGLLTIPALEILPTPQTLTITRNR